MATQCPERRTEVLVRGHAGGSRTRDRCRYTARAHPLPHSALRRSAQRGAQHRRRRPCGMRTVCLVDRRGPSGRRGIPNRRPRADRAQADRTQAGRIGHGLRSRRTGRYHRPFLLGVATETLAMAAGGTTTSGRRSRVRCSDRPRGRALMRSGDPRRVQVALVAAPRGRDGSRHSSSSMWGCSRSGAVMRSHSSPRSHLMLAPSRHWSRRTCRRPGATRSSTRICSTPTPTRRPANRTSAFSMGFRASPVTARSSTPATRRKHRLRSAS